MKETITVKDLEEAFFLLAGRSDLFYCSIDRHIELERKIKFIIKQKEEEVMLK